MTVKKIPPAGGNRQDGGGAKLDIGGPVSARNHSTPETETQPPIITDLAAVGVEFTLPNRGNKQPFTKGWPSYRPGLATVAAHLAAGGNLGVHVTGYTDGRILAYFDADDGPGLAALLRVAPELTGSLQSWRDSGSGKVFFWTSPDGLSQQATPDLDGPHTKREFKISGQAAIFGVHPSGERYQTNWAAPITLTPERVRAIWEAWTGQEWKEGKKQRERVNPGQGYTRRDGDDVDRVKAAWTPSAVFAHHWPGCQIVKDRGGELRILGKGGLLCNDDDGLWHSFAENTGGDVFNAWAYAGGLDIDRDFPAILREMATVAGIALTPRQTRRDGDPDSDDNDTGGQGTIAGKINALRLRLRSIDFAELVPLELQSIKRYRTGDRDRVVADAALGYLWEVHTLEARISNLELSERTGYSPNGCGAAMKRLVNIFQPIDDGGPGKQATRYKINDALLCDTNNTVDPVSQSSAAILSTHRAHDVFVRSLSAITPERIAEINAKRRENRRSYESAMEAAATPKERAAIDETYKGVPQAPMRDNRQLRARLEAQADALGPGVLRLVDALHMYGAMDRDALAVVLYKSPTAARRLASKAVDAGLVDEDESGNFTLAGGWSERVNELDAIAPTAGTIARRRLAAADSRLRYCESALETTVDQTKAETLRRRKERAESQKWALLQVEVIAYNERAAAAGLAGVTMADAIKLGRGETFADWQRRRVMDAQIREFARTLVGLDKETAEQTAYYAGYSAYDFAQAWALRAVA